MRTFDCANNRHKNCSHSTRKNITKKKVNREPHRIPYASWANSQLSIAKYYGGCTLNGKTYTLDYENARKEGDKYFPDLVELIK